MYHQDLYYEDEDSEFETLGIPSDEETRHINEVPLEKGTKKGNNSVGMTHKPKIPPKPKWTPAMDLSQLNNNEENLHKRTLTLEKKGATSSTPTISSSEKPSMAKQASLQPQKMVAFRKNTDVNTSQSGTQHLTASNDQSSLLNNAYQPSNLSNLKFGDDSSSPNTPDAAKKKDAELVSFADTVTEDVTASPEIVKTNNTSHSDNLAKEDEDVFKSLSIDSGEHDEVVSDGEDDVLEENHDEMVDLPDGDEETAKEAARLRLKSVQSESREKEQTEEDMSSPTWPVHRKHIFILSKSGKPVYARYGCEEKLVGLFGIMQALISIVEDGNDVLRSFIAGGHKFVFMVKGPLMFVAVSQGPEYEQQIIQQMTYGYYQILSVLTFTQLHNVFQRKPNFDLRFLLQGSEKFIDNVLSLADTEPSFIMCGIRCLPMSPTLRLSISNILMQFKTKEVLFAIMVAANQLVTMVKPKECTLHPVDVHLIMNLIDASTSFRSAESWTPLCLPKFSEKGFLHAHVSYLSDSSPACLMLLSNDREKFFTLQDCRQKIVARLNEVGCIQLIKQAVHRAEYPINPDAGCIGLRHFIYKSKKTSCLTSPRLPVLYCNPQQKERLFGLYMFMHHRMHSKIVPVKIFYHVGGMEALLGWRTDEFDLYLVFSPLVGKLQVIQAGNNLIKWIKSQEDKLILTTIPTY